MKFILILGILLGSLMCSSGVDSLPLGTEAKIEAYLYENGYKATSGEISGFIGGANFGIAVIENNAIKEIIGDPQGLQVIVSKAGFSNYVNRMISEHIQTYIAPRGAGEYGIWMFGFDGETSAHTTVTGFKRFFVTGTPGNISFDGASVTNMAPVRNRKLPILYPDAKRVVIKGNGFTHDSNTDSSLMLRLTNIDNVVTHTYILVPPEVSTNTAGVVEVTLNNNAVERFCLETGQKVPSEPMISLLQQAESGPRLDVTGPPANYIIECSTNLVDWHPMTTVVVSFAKASAVDVTTTKQKFYRVKIAP